MEMLKEPKRLSPFSSENILVTLICRLEPSPPPAAWLEEAAMRELVLPTVEMYDNNNLPLDRRYSAAIIDERSLSVYYSH